jgi:hypothetical protein
VIVGNRGNIRHRNNQTGVTEMKHHKYHQHYQVKAAKLHARAEAALDLITALVIGIGLAACLFYGWSA